MELLIIHGSGVFDRPKLNPSSPPNPPRPPPLPRPNPPPRLNPPRIFCVALLLGPIPDTTGTGGGVASAAIAAISSIPFFRLAPSGRSTVSTFEVEEMSFGSEISNLETVFLRSMPLRGWIWGRSGGGEKWEVRGVVEAERGGVGFWMREGEGWAEVVGV